MVKGQNAVGAASSVGNSSCVLVMDGDVGWVQWQVWKTWTLKPFVAACKLLTPESTIPLFQTPYPQCHAFYLAVYSCSPRNTAGLPKTRES